MLKRIFFKNHNKINRDLWLRETLGKLPVTTKLLDAGAGELQNKKYCNHLNYFSQDFCKYDGLGDGKGLQTSIWDTSQIDVVSDIIKMPFQNSSFDAILCSEVFEHIPNPLLALEEFSRVLKPGGKLIITAPFASFVHFAPYYFYSGYSKYWYEHHLPNNGFKIIELSANGDWYDYCRQEILRLGPFSRKEKEPLWPLAMVLSVLANLYFFFRGLLRRGSGNMACFGWHCVATKE